MTTRTLVYAISKYYRVSYEQAAVMYANRTREDEFEQVETWYFENQEEE